MAHMPHAVWSGGSPHNETGPPRHVSSVCADKPGLTCPRAASMSPDERLDLACRALAPDANRAQLARDAHVSRPFLYRQLHCAPRALEHAFAPEDHDARVLFHLPLTRAWLHMFALVLDLTCRASYRNIRRAMDLLLDTSMSMGSLHNLFAHTATKVDELHEHEPLEQLTLGAHDELFHVQRPILSGVDVPLGRLLPAAIVPRPPVSLWPTGTLHATFAPTLPHTRPGTYLSVAGCGAYFPLTRLTPGRV